MSISENEALASLKILVAVARADGTVHNDERKSLAAALESLELPGAATVDKLLVEDVDVAAQLGELKSPEARDQIYRSAFFMAYADGNCSKEERAVLDQIAAATDPSAETKASLERVFVGRAKGGGPRTSIAAISDPVTRAAEVKKWVLRYSILTAALGAFPVPGLAIATDLAVIALQLKMIRDLAGYWGHDLDRQAAKSILYGVGLGTGARLAIANLAKLLPTWGSVVGATTSFASTYALGNVIDTMFAAGKVDVSDDVRTEFKSAESEARAVYQDQKDVIIESQRSNKAALDALTSDLKAGKITQDEFDARVAALA
jgi:uncharacterized protein (DUF697 family)/tellurite resistance protein